MKHIAPTHKTFPMLSGRILLLLCVMVLGLSGTLGHQVDAVHAATSPTLGTAASFAVLGGTTVTNTGATSITGDVGVSPGTSITGFPPGVVSGGSLHAGDATATQAEADLATAYAVLAGEAVDTSLSGQDLGGLTLTPGVYNFSAAATMNGTLTLDAQGDPNAVFVIQTGTTLTTATNAAVNLINGARAQNVFWQVGSSATLGTGTAFQGSILAFTAIVLNSGAALQPGRALAINGAVTMDTNAAAVPAPTPLTITADDQSMVYGAALPALTVSYTGFTNGDTSANLTTQPTCFTTATSSSPVGTYAITCSDAVDPYYTISYESGTLSITPAPLTITADDQTKVYGAAVPTLTASYTGFVNGDTSANLTTQPTLTTTATAAGHVSGSPYSITASGAVDPNYTISYVPGNLSVTTAPLTITADNQTKAFGATVPPLTASYTGFVNGDTSASLTTQPTCTTTATMVSPPGPYAITCPGAVDSDYTISYVAGTLTIPGLPVTNPPPAPTKITPVLTWATPADITFGTALGSSQLNATTSVPGTFTYSSPAGSVLAVGTHLLTVLFTPFDTANYNAASALVSINVLAAPQVAATATTVPATPSATSIPPTVAAPLVVATATATVSMSVAPAMTIHNERHTIVGGLVASCVLSRNLTWPYQPGCLTASTIWLPGAHVTYTLTFPDGTTQQSTDIADARGHSLQVFAVHYLPPVGAPRGPMTIAHITAVGTLGTLTMQAGIRFAAIR